MPVPVPLLSQPYPRDKSTRWYWRASLLIGLFTGLFLLAFQPFGIAQWTVAHKPVKILGFGLNTFLVTALNFMGWPRLFPRYYAPQRWTVGREIVTLSLTPALIALVNYRYLMYLLHQDISVSGLFEMLAQTFLLGMFPIGGLVIANYTVQLQRYTRLAGQLSPPPPHESFMPPDVLTVTGDVAKDTLTLMADDLLYAEADGNYTTIVHGQRNQLTKTLLRCSLGRLESQIQQQTPAPGSLVRCHRSFLVNLDRVERVTGNAQGYRFQLTDGAAQIPIGRTYTAVLARWKPV